MLCGLETDWYVEDLYLCGVTHAFSSSKHVFPQSRGAAPQTTTAETPGPSGLVTSLTQEDARGPAISLHGQIESVCVFHDAVLHEQAKTLSLIGQATNTVSLSS